MYQDLHIIDFHAHFPTSKPFFGGIYAEQRKKRAEEIGEERMKLSREYALSYNKAWRMAWDFPKPETDLPSDAIQAKRWKEELDKYGIDLVAFVTGGGNENLNEIVRLHPDRFIGFAHHDPFEEDAADNLYHAVEKYHFKGYKLLAPALSGSIADKALYPVWEACADLNIPVLIHYGILGAGGGIAWHENINPLTLNPVARDFPDVTFIVPHFGCGWIRETLMLCWACKNVIVDTSGSNQWVRWMDGDWNVKRLFRKYMETIGPERIVFGTDSSWFPRGFAIRYLLDQLRDARELNLTHDQLQMIFAGNAARILGIHLADFKK
jgi:hypothetical protein